MNMVKENKIIFFNPRSGRYNHRVPISILQIAASIQDKYEYVIVDSNLETDPWNRIKDYISTGEFKYFAATVMPGPQIKQAIPITKKIKLEYPQMTIVWGGYFASNQYVSSINSGYIDYIVSGPGDNAFPDLIDALELNKSLEGIENLIYRKENKIIKNKKGEIPDQNLLKPLPYDTLNKFYPIKNYIGRTFLGSKTFAYHSSMGCPVYMFLLRNSTYF